MSSLHLAGQQMQATAPNESSQLQQTPRGNTRFESAYPMDAFTAGKTSPEFNDSGFFENEETNTPRADYQDFTLFYHDQPDYAVRRANDFFADADASTTIANQGSIYDSNHENSQIEQEVSYAYQRTPPQRTVFYDAVRDAKQQAVDEAVTAALTNNYDAQPEYDSFRSPPPTPYLRPLELWENTFKRHESIAYRFEQPPQLVRAQRSRQQ